MINDTAADPKATILARYEGLKFVMPARAADTSRNGKRGARRSNRKTRTIL